MKLKELKEYINSLPEELDNQEVYIRNYNMEQGLTYEPVKSLQPVKVKSEKRMYTDSFDGMAYYAYTIRQANDNNNSTDALEVSTY